MDARSLPIKSLSTLQHEAHYEVENQKVASDYSEFFPTLISLWPPEPGGDETQKVMRYENQDLEPLWPVRTIPHLGDDSGNVK